MGDKKAQIGRIYDEGIRSLAISILGQAAKDSMMISKTLASDYRSKTSHNKTQRQATKWLQSDECIMICLVLDIDHDRLMKRVEANRQRERV